MKKILTAIALGSLFLLPSCVNEWPHPEDRIYDVNLLVHCHTDWLPDYDYNYTREEGYELQYQFEIYPAGNTTDIVKSFTLYSDDFTRSDFNVQVSLYPGSYDIYVWSDVCAAANNKPLYYDSSDFARITYTTPYIGNANNKDAFRGVKNFTIETSMYLNPTATEVINLERPLARYIFIATDVEDFIEKEQTRGKMHSLEASRAEGDEAYRSELDNVLEDYTIRINYPLYMPSEFDNFLNRPINSWTGISFPGEFKLLSDTDEAQLGMDYVMVNTDDSMVQVSMEVFDSEGVKISGTGTINIPTLRDRTTIVYGRFLTSQEDAGVTIDPSFAGQFNIPYK